MTRKLVRQMLTAQILSALTVSLCLLIDNVMINRFLGVNAIAAYELSNPVLLIIGAIGSMLSAGIQVACSKSLGNGSAEETNRNYSTAAALTLIISVVFMAVVLLFREPFTSRKLLAVLLNILGCALTATGGRLEPGALSVAGILTGIGAGFCYSLTPVFGHFGTKRMDSRVMTLYSFLFAALFLFLRLRPWNGGAAFSGKILLWGALFALIPTVLAYVLYYRGLSRILEPSRVPVIASVETVVAAAVGMALYHDRLGLWGMLGILLVLVSIGVMNLPDPKKQGKTGQITGK